MSAPLRKQDLLKRVLLGVDASGWQALVVHRSHPFDLRLFRCEDADFISLRIYIWNCTPGGRNRPVDEFRVQLTGTVPQAERGEITLLLGWHEGYGVFVGFDMRRHAGQASASPSIQVKEASLLNAHNRAFSAYDRANGEIAICFRPEFLVEYCMNLATLHGFTADDEALGMLNTIDTLNERDVETRIASFERREVIATIRKKYREYDFRRRVVTAYAATCAFCGVQLRLVEAAHIIPVAADSSTDETRNGVALCALHHRAYDQNLISFDEAYRIEVSATAIMRLSESGLAGGLAAFREGIKSAIVLPADKRDYPARQYVAKSREIRQWQT